MNSLRHSRGYELADHRQAKLRGWQMMCEAGFDLVVCECRNADVVGICRIGGQLHVVTVEFERTCRNVISNIRRNLAHGSDCVLEVCMVSSIEKPVQRLVQKDLTGEEQKKVLVVGMDELTVDLLWVMSGKRGVNSESIPVDSRVDSTGTGVDSGLFPRI